jgi:hypothetical protein
MCEAHEEQGHTEIDYTQKDSDGASIGTKMQEGIVAHNGAQLGQSTPSGADAVQETGLTARERKIEGYTNLLARARSAEQISQLIIWDDNFFAQAVDDVRRNGFDSEFAALSGFKMGRMDDPNKLADALVSQREQFATAILNRADFAGAIATRGLNGIGVDGFEGMSHPEVAKLSSDTIDFFGDPTSFEDVTREQFQAMYSSGLMDYKTHDVVGFPAEQRRLDKASLIASVVTFGMSIALNPRAAINTVKGIGKAGVSALQLSGKQLGRLKDVFTGNFAAIASRTSATLKGGAAFRNGIYVHGINARSNAEIYGKAITRTPDEAKVILQKLGYDKDLLGEYHFIPLDDMAYQRKVDQLGGDFDATYGNVASGVETVSFKNNIQSSLFTGETKIPVYVRRDVFDSDESIAQVLSHEISEIEELRYLIKQPVRTQDYFDLVRPNKANNLHFNAVLEGDDMVRVFRGLQNNGR